jgi:hypothetical protein
MGMAVVAAVALALAACGPTAGTVGPDPTTGGTQGPPGGGVTPSTSDDAGAPSCPPRNHVCKCATGTYCLALGAACMAPDTPCPTQ